MGIFWITSFCVDSVADGFGVAFSYSDANCNADSNSYSDANSNSDSNFYSY